jgi:hypothetical protein
MFDQRGQNVRNSQVNIGGEFRNAPRQKLYSGIMLAKHGEFFHWKPYHCIAESLESAIGKGLLQCKIAFPMNDAFVNHTADMLEVPFYLIREVLESKQGE